MGKWNKVYTYICAGIAVGVVFSCVQFFFGETNTVQGLVFDQHVTQVEMLGQRQAPFDAFVDTLVAIAQEKGGVYAYEVLKEADTPFGLDTHLLGHYIGDELYKQEGVAGMQYCTHDFRNACSHTMVIGALQDSGVAAIETIRQACADAPGGSGAYTMCFHGLGHGVLAYNGYDMGKTVRMCELFGTDAYAQQEAVECFGGAIMEIIGGGGHDTEIWEAQRAVYLDPQKPFDLCVSESVPQQYGDICFTYMTPFAYEAAGAQMQSPDDAVLATVFEQCDTLSDTSSRKACFGGQGKEFIGLATGRDFSHQSSPTVEQLEEMRRMCALTSVQDGYIYCIESVVDSLYWGGENEYTGPLVFCSLKHPEYAVQACFQELTRVVGVYGTSPEYKEVYCHQVPLSMQESCMMSML